LEKCLVCKKNPGPPKTLITIRTLHIRDLGGEKKVQAVGNVIEEWVCGSCIQKEMDHALNPGKIIWKKTMLYAVLAAAGIAIAVFFHERVLRIFGAAAVLCAVVCLYSDLTKISKRRKSTIDNSPEENNTFYSLELIRRNLPRKNGEEDLTYIPMERSLVSASLGDMGVEYGLIPEIARQVRDITAKHFALSSSAGDMETGKIL
jgi:hypothetical protein